VASFLRGAARALARGGPAYWVWLGFLLLLIGCGVGPYAAQLRDGLAVTGMRDPMSWGLYIGNFTFLAGLGATSVLLALPELLRDRSPLRRLTVFAELLAVSAVVMCILFVTVDVGRPERVLSLIPFVGRLHLPASMLAWDVVILGAFGVAATAIVVHQLVTTFHGRAGDRRVVVALALIAAPLAVGMPTALIYGGLAARPGWHTAALAPRFLASAFCASLAVMIVLSQALDRLTALRIDARAVQRLARLLAVAACANLFLKAAELFTELSSGHAEHVRYLYAGLDGRAAMTPYVWGGLACDLLALALLLVPWTRRRFFTLSLACALAFVGVYIDKGMAFVVGGFVPSPLGEVFEYVPTVAELRIAAAIFGIGFLLFTLTSKVAVLIETGELRHVDVAPSSVRDGVAPAAVEG
jgi:Ni/Fe-hydrogenase subunit HybB-like protein